MADVALKELLGSGHDLLAFRERSGVLRCKGVRRVRPEVLALGAALRRAGRLPDSMSATRRRSSSRVGESSAIVISLRLGCDNRDV